MNEREVGAMSKPVVPLKLELDTEVVARHLDEINARLPNATPEGAYALGLLSVMVFRHQVLIPNSVLDAAMTALTIQDGLDVARTCWDIGVRER